MARRRRPPRPGALTELPPLKILSQIVLLQIIYYIAGTSLILFTALVAGRHFSLDLVLSWRSLRGDTTVGWMLGLVWLLNSLIGFVPLAPSAYIFILGIRLEIELMEWKQSNSPSDPHIPKQTSPRFRAHYPLHPPNHHIPLFAFHTPELVMVAIANCKRWVDD